MNFILLWIWEGGWGSWFSPRAGWECLEKGSGLSPLPGYFPSLFMWTWVPVGPPPPPWGDALFFLGPIDR